jgi:diaminobutyrate-2-oxoglutarate transaminase
LGLIIETGGRYGAVMRFLPSLITTKKDIDKVIEILHESMLRVVD